MLSRKVLAAAACSLLRRSRSGTLDLQVLRVVDLGRRGVSVVHSRHHLVVLAAGAARRRPSRRREINGRHAIAGTLRLTRLIAIVDDEGRLVHVEVRGRRRVVEVARGAV